MILMKYHTLFFQKLRKMLQNLSSAAVVIGALRVKVRIYIYRSSGYHCTGNMTEWTKCMYKTRAPKRKTFKIPKEYHDVDVL